MVQAKKQEIIIIFFCVKYCKRTIPSESTLRKSYLKIFARRLKAIHIFNFKIIDSTQHRFFFLIREDISNWEIWISMDKTNDSFGRYISNFIIGYLLRECSSNAHLFAYKALNKIIVSEIMKKLSFS